MKKIFITLILSFIIVYPPYTSKASENSSVNESIINYLEAKNGMLKYQVEKKINKFNLLYDSLTTNN